MKTSLLTRWSRQSAAIGLVFSLIASSSHVAEAASTITAARPDYLRLAPPMSLGFVTDHFESTAKDPRTVILIQDLHAHYGVQKNIAGFLDFLTTRLSKNQGEGSEETLDRGTGVTPTRRPDVSTPLPFALAVEGASGPIDASVMALFPDQKIKQAAADYLMREGEYSGAEYFAALRGLPHALIGVEHPDYYVMHRELFRKTYQDRAQVVGLLKGLQADIRALKARSLSKDLQEIQRHQEAYESGRTGHRDTVAWLSAQVSPFGMVVDPRSKPSDLAPLFYLLRIQTAATPAEKDLVQVEHDLALLLRVADLQATEQEVRAFAPRLNPFVALCHSLLTSNGFKAFDAARLRELLSTSIDYYAMAMMRNRPMVDNTLALLKQKEMAVLVAGGFHTAPISKLLREKNVSYLVITPKVDELSAAQHELYVKRLNGDLLTENEVLAATVSTGEERSMLARLWGHSQSGLSIGAGVVSAGVTLTALYMAGAQNHPSTAYLTTFSGILGYIGARNPEVQAWVQRMTLRTHQGSKKVLVKGTDSPQSSASPTQSERRAEKQSIKLLKPPARMNDGSVVYLFGFGERATAKIVIHSDHINVLPDAPGRGDEVYDFARHASIALGKPLYSDSLAQGNLSTGAQHAWQKLVQAGKARLRSDKQVFEALPPSDPGPTQFGSALAILLGQTVSGANSSATARRNSHYDEPPNRAIAYGRVPTFRLKWLIRKKIRQMDARKVWSRSQQPPLVGDVAIRSGNRSEESAIDAVRLNLSADAQRTLNQVDIVVLEGTDFLYFADPMNHQPARASNRRPAIYIGEGLWNRITRDKEALLGLLAHELHHIAHPEEGEDAALAAERQHDPEGALRLILAKLVLGAHGFNEAVVGPEISKTGFADALKNGELDQAESILAYLESRKELSPYDKVNLANDLRRARDAGILDDLYEAVQADAQLIIDIQQNIRRTNQTTAEDLSRMKSAVESIRYALETIPLIDPLVQHQNKQRIAWMQSWLPKAEAILAKASIREEKELPQAPVPNDTLQMPAVAMGRTNLQDFRALTSRVGVEVDGSLSPATVLAKFPPENQMRFGEVTYYLSAPYQSRESKRPAFMVYIHRKNPETGKEEIFVRVLYKSNSQKTLWRFASHHQGRWIGKGLGEETTDAPLELMPLIHAIFTQYASKPLRTLSGFYDVLEEGGHAAPTGFQRSIHWKTHMFGKEEREASEVGQFVDYESPGGFSFNEGYEPDFDGGIVEVYETNDALSGQLKNYRILSKNRQVQYLFIEELEGKRRVEIGTVQTLNPRTTRFGVRANRVHIPSGLLMPANEYREQIPEHYMGDHVSGSYWDASNFIELLPPIIEFRRKVLKQSITHQDLLLLRLPPLVRQARGFMESAKANTKYPSLLREALEGLLASFPDPDTWTLNATTLDNYLADMRLLEQKIIAFENINPEQCNAHEFMNDALLVLRSLNDEMTAPETLTNAALTHGLTRVIGNGVAGLLRRIYLARGNTEKAERLGRSGRHAIEAEKRQRRIWIQEQFAPRFPLEAIALALLAGPFADWHGDIEGDHKSTLKAQRRAAAERIQASAQRPVRRLGRYYRAISRIAWLAAIPAPIRAVVVPALALYRGLRINVRMHETWNRRHGHDGAALTAGDDASGIPPAPQPQEGKTRMKAAVKGERLLLPIDVSEFWVTAGDRLFKIGTIANGRKSIQQFTTDKKAAIGPLQFLIENKGSYINTEGRLQSSKPESPSAQLFELGHLMDQNGVTHLLLIENTSKDTPMAIEWKEPVSATSTSSLIDDSLNEPTAPQKIPSRPTTAAEPGTESPNEGLEGTPPALSIPYSEPIQIRIETGPNSDDYRTLEVRSYADIQQTNPDLAEDLDREDGYFVVDPQHPRAYVVLPLEQNVTIGRITPQFEFPAQVSRLQIRIRRLASDRISVQFIGQAPGTVLMRWNAWRPVLEALTGAKHMSGARGSLVTKRMTFKQAKAEVTDRSAAWPADIVDSLVPPTDTPRHFTAFGTLLAGFLIALFKRDLAAGREASRGGWARLFHRRNGRVDPAHIQAALQREILAFDPGASVVVERDSRAESRLHGGHHWVERVNGQRVHHVAYDPHARESDLEPLLRHELMHAKREAQGQTAALRARWQGRLGKKLGGKVAGILEELATIYDASVAVRTGDTVLGEKVIPEAALAMHQSQSNAPVDPSAVDSVVQGLVQALERATERARILALFRRERAGLHGEDLRSLLSAA